jgi:D-3-phosphoglycerate dehydrogenase
VGSFKVVLTDFTDTDQQIEAGVFASSGLDLELIKAVPNSSTDLARIGPDADALLVQFAVIDRRVLESLRRCQIISRYGVGVDMIDVAAAGEFGIPVANVPSFCIDEVSTQTIGFIIDLNRRTLALNDYVHRGHWGSRPIPVTAPRRVAGQTLGIVGLGMIGSEVARKASALGLAILAYDPYVQTPWPGAELVSLPELLARSDYVSLHCPLVDETRGLIAAAQLAMMRPSAYLLNLSRGPVVDQSALIEALTKGVIAGTALDVMATEPPSPHDPLLDMANVILTPHTSSWSIESIEQLRRDAAVNVVEALSGRQPRSVVNRAYLRARP